MFTNEQPQRSGPTPQEANMPKAPAPTTSDLRTAEPEATTLPIPRLRDQLEPSTPSTHNRLRFKGIRRLGSEGIRRLRARAERGAITAEYAVLIVGACAFGGGLIALLRSPAMQSALKAIINYGLKIAGVEGVHI